MAGDWVKARSELLEHPKLLSMVGTYLYEPDYPGLFQYVYGTHSPADYQESALRDVTFAALLRVWCAVNAHCKIVKTDAIMAPMTLHDIDQIAGIKTFGEVMMIVKWVIDEGHKVLIFPNFLEFNEPACLRLPPKTDAERQRECRARKRPSEPVTNVTNVTIEKRREEKRREDKEGARAPFAKPTFEEVAAYCTERKNTVDAQTFIDHYEANGWRVGRNQMRDWRAAVRTWERNGFANAPPPKPRADPVKRQAEQRAQAAQQEAAALSPAEIQAALDRMRKPQERSCNA